jgi:Multidrug resistance efflux pump
MYQSEKDSKGQYSDVSFAQLQQLAKCLNNVDTLESNLSDLNAKIKQAELQVDSSNITAQQDGIVNNIVDIGVGDVLSAGTAIATVIPHDESEYKVQLYVANKDIAGIEVGDTVRYNISAMPSNQYGAVEGKVLSVSQDTKVQNNQQSGYYLVEASIANGTLTDKDGNQAKISVGMTLEGKVVTQRKRILSYLLEKIK